MRALLLSFLFFSLSAAAAPVVPPTEPDTLLGLAPPYLPREYDYSIEGGMLSAQSDLVWLGASLGKHLGRCVFTASETCQQYLDGAIGVAAREGETQGHYWMSLRWQYVNLPDRYSPYWRLLWGAASLARAREDRFWRPIGGAGIGVTTYLHDKVDLRLELRGLVIDRFYLEPTIGINIKIDRLLSVFAGRLRDLGVGTVETAVEATGTAIKATGEGLGGVIKGVAKPFRKDAPVDEKK